MRYLALLAFLFVTPALAQQQSTAADRLGVTLGQCVAAAESKVDQVNALLAEVTALRTKLKEHEDKTAAEKPKDKE